MKTVFLISFLMIFIALEGFASKRITNGEKIRRKRSFICRLGLTNLIEKAVFASLNNFRDHDPLEIGASPSGTFKDGVLRGLSTLTNLTEFEVYCAEKNLIVFTSAIGLKDIHVRYNWDCGCFFSFEGMISVKIKEINVNFDVRLNSTKGMNFDVNRLAITKLEGFHFGFSGLGPFNPFARIIMRVVSWFRKGKEKERLESYMREALEKKLVEIGISLNLFKVVSIFL